MINESIVLCWSLSFSFSFSCTLKLLHTNRVAYFFVLVECWEVVRWNYVKMRYELNGFDWMQRQQQLKTSKQIHFTHLYTNLPFSSLASNFLEINFCILLLFIFVSSENAQFCSLLVYRKLFTTKLYKNFFLPLFSQYSPNVFLGFSICLRQRALTQLLFW